MGALCFMLGTVFSCVGLILALFLKTESPVVTLTALIGLPVCAGLLGFGGMALACWLYNELARWTGGIRVDLEDESVATRAPSEEGQSAQPQAAEEQFELRSISIFRIKLSKDQPGGEWIDVRNHGIRPMNTANVGLYHQVYSGSRARPETRLVVSLPDCSLKPGEILRVHSSRPRDLSVLQPEDRMGAEWHSFTGEDAQVWNTREGDTPALRETATSERIDSASYDPNPPEGVVLHREGSRLVPVSVAAAGHRA